MKSDALFYHLFREFPSIFFELIGREASEAEAYTFASVEIKQLAFRIDGVFLPKRDDEDHPVYFVEVQFQKDSRIYARMCSEIFVYLYQQDIATEWLGVVLFPDRQTEPEIPSGYRKLIENGLIRRLYLEDLRKQSDQSLAIGIVSLVVEPEESAAAKARHLIDQARLSVRGEPNQDALIELVELIIMQKFTDKSRKEVEQMLGLIDLKKTRVYREAKEDGLLEGLLEAVSIGLELRFGIEGLRLLSEIGRIQDEEVLKAVLRAIASGKTLEEIRIIYKE